MSYYEIISNKWREGKEEEAARIFRDAFDSEQLEPDEVKRLLIFLPIEDEDMALIEYQMGRFENATPEVVLQTYEAVLDKRGWSDSELAERLRIDPEETGRIRQREPVHEWTFKRLDHELMKAILDEVLRNLGLDKKDKNDRGGAR